MTEQGIEGLARRRRVPAATRKELMLATALRMARAEGAGALTLAKVADACGVTKPIAYKHFTSLAGLMLEMLHRVGAEYETTVMEVMAQHQGGQTTRGEALRALGKAYIECSLENGALHADIAAAVIASGGPRSAIQVDDAARYAGLMRELLGLDERVAYALTTGLLGAADRLCESVLADRLTQAEAVEVLLRFVPDPTQTNGGPDEGRAD